MEPARNLDEISALRGKARGKTSAVHSPAEAATVTPFDPRQSGQLSAAQTSGIEALHKTCAAKISDSLGALVRTSLQLDLDAVEQSSGAEFLERLPDPTYLVSFKTSLGACAMMQIDLSLVFPLLDLVLGGSGKDAVEVRDVTEIEEDILQPLSRAIGISLQEAWQSVLKVDFDFDRRLQKTEAAAFLSPGNKLLLVSFQVRLQETQGRLVLAFPSLLAAALLRRLTPQETASAPALPQDRSRLQERLLDGKFEAELLLPQSTVSIRQLYALKPGDVVMLQVRSNEPLPVHVAGRNMFLASPVRSGSRRGAQVQQILSIVPEKEGEEGK